MGILGWLRGRFVKPLAKSEDKQRLLEAMRDLRQQFECLESLFNMTSDADLIDYYVHQHRALEARYAYLIKQARMMGLSYQPRASETALR